jgi:hypothetical protein
MSSESAVNPYSVGTDLERSEFAWTDGDVEFTEDEIRVHGDFELPQICIHTGATEDLVQRDKRLEAESISASRVQWVVTVMLPVVFLLLIVGSLWPAVIPGFNLGRPEQVWGILAILTVRAGLSLLVSKWSHKITVKWYLSRSYAMPRERRRRISVVLVVLAVILALPMILETGSWWWLLPVVVAAVAGIILGGESEIGAREFRDGQFVLTGHSAEFAHAWASKTEARYDEQRG